MKVKGCGGAGRRSEDKARKEILGVGHPNKEKFLADLQGRNDGKEDDGADERGHPRADRSEQ